MITAENYFEKIKEINISDLPAKLREGYYLVKEVTENHSTWGYYRTGAEIRALVDEYFANLSDLLKKSNERNDDVKTLAREAAKDLIRSDVKNGRSVSEIRRSQSGIAKGDVWAQVKGDKVLVEQIQGKWVNYSFSLQTLFNEVKQEIGGEEGKKEKEVKVKKRANKKSAKSAEVKPKGVDSIREEVRFIKRFVGFHNRVKSPNAVLVFIKGLQRAIVQKLIRKTSPFAKEIEMIQDKLVKAYNKMKGDESFSINGKDLGRLVAIAGGEQVYPSISVIKRFVGLQDNADEKKINAFIKYIDNLFKSKKLTKNDPYVDKVKAIYKSIKNRKGDKIPIGKAELNGLEGVISACGCTHDLGKIYNTKGRRLRQCRSKKYSDAARGACSHNKGLSGVLTAEEMANRKLDLLPFYSFWETVFGRPSKNFTAMFHGEPHHGKTILLLKFANFLAANFGRVLYVSSEEFASPTMSAKVKEFVNPLSERLHFAENLNDPELSNYDFVILDSVNDLGLKLNQYKELRKQYPETAFIFILQHTKSGEFRGGKDWEHLAEIVGEIHRGAVTITKNRYSDKTSFDFFRHFGLEWQEPKEISTIPRLGDGMVTEDNTHY